MARLTEIIQDFLPVFKKRLIRFSGHHQEEADVVVFEFARPEDLLWQAGQHGIFSFPAARIKGSPFRAFSIASAPHDTVLRIATRVSHQPSDFKRHLMALKEGDTMNLRGPFGPFHLDNSGVPVIFIAGGIGITPFMGILRECSFNRGSRPPAVHLLYSSRDRRHAFRDEINDMFPCIAGLSVHFLGGRDETSRCLTALTGSCGDQAHYYIAGTVSMIRGCRRDLRDRGVASRKICSDWFIGYWGKRGKAV